MASPPLTRTADAPPASPAHPYRLVAREGKPDHEGNLTTRPVRIGPVVVGAGTDPVIIAGPCAVESREQTLAIARACREAGAHMLRGGAFKPRTSPYDFQGLGERGLEILAEARELTGLPIVTEVLDPRLVELVGSYADCFQIGARNMQNQPLLREVGRYGKPVLLKRHWGATLKELLCAAEYIALEGNLDILLCERGIRTFTRGEYSRGTLDVTAVPALRRRTILPVIVDPSHATGDDDHVADASRAGLGAGAHGLLIEVFQEDAVAADALCDGDQCIRPSVLEEIVADARALAALARERTAS